MIPQDGGVRRLERNAAVNGVSPPRQPVDPALTWDDAGPPAPGGPSPEVSVTADPTARPAPPRPAHAGVGAERVDAGYLERRRLRTGTAGWLLLAGLGVSAVISGDYAG